MCSLQESPVRHLDLYQLISLSTATKRMMWVGLLVFRVSDGIVHGNTCCREAGLAKLSTIQPSPVSLLHHLYIPTITSWLLPLQTTRSSSFSSNPVYPAGLHTLGERADIPKGYVQTMWRCQYVGDCVTCELRVSLHYSSMLPMIMRPSDKAQ